MRKDFYKLILVTQKKDQPLELYLKFLKSCIMGGITGLQLREKKLNSDQILSFGRSLKTLLKPEKIPLIVNDSLHLANALEADGLHLGQTDGNILESRNRLGPEKIIGLTVNSYEEVSKANELPIDYIGVGAIFPTVNKPNVQNIWGYEGLEKVSSLSRHKIVAIGGIEIKNTKNVIKAGAHGIAAIGAFHNSKNPFQTTKTLRKEIDEALFFPLQKKEKEKNKIKIQRKK